MEEDRDDKTGGVVRFVAIYPVLELWFKKMFGFIGFVVVKHT